MTRTFGGLYARKLRGPSRFVWTQESLGIIIRGIFVPSFVIMSRVLCALLMAIPTFPKIISREFVLVGFVSHLSVLFF
jgi:hypothetical protein